MYFGVQTKENLDGQFSELAKSLKRIWDPYLTFGMLTTEHFDCPMEIYIFGVHTKVNLNGQFSELAKSLKRI